jgi:hypothetical protein
VTELARKEQILVTAGAMGMRFAYYDRKEDKKLPPESLTEALEGGEVTLEEIAAAFIHTA